jgi:hypothetical protein
MAQPEAHNFRLLAHDTLGNAGNVGEGVSLQVRPDGRRILWMAHECAPKNYTAVDVTDPTRPRMILQTELPHRNVRSNSLEVCGDIMAVAYQTGRTCRLTPSPTLPALPSVSCASRRKLCASGCAMADPP